MYRKPATVPVPQGSRAALEVQVEGEEAMPTMV
jgi:hypothetical protein